MSESSALKYMADKEEAVLQSIEELAQELNLSLKEKSQLIRNLYSDAEILKEYAFGTRTTLKDMHYMIKGSAAVNMSLLLKLSDTDPDSALDSFRGDKYKYMFPELRDLEELVEQTLLMRVLGPCDPAIFEEG